MTRNYYKKLLQEIITRCVTQIYPQKLSREIIGWYIIRQKVMTYRDTAYLKNSLLPFP